MKRNEQKDKGFVMLVKGFGSAWATCVNGLNGMSANTNKIYRNKKKLYKIQKKMRKRQ